MKSAPLYVDTFAFCEWLYGRFGEDRRFLAREVCARSLELLDAIVLALKGFSRAQSIEEADRQVLFLRHRLRLAEALGYLSAAQSIHALERLDTIGRQLGGWSRSIGGA